MSHYAALSAQLIKSPCLDNLSSVRPVILCDFDGTVSTDDVTDTLLKHFGQAGWIELEDLWEAGEIGSRECMSGQIKLLNASPAELNACLDKITIDPFFFEFVTLTKQYSVAIEILSDGLDYAIQYILQRHRLNNLPIYANHFQYAGNKKWTLQFPYTTPECLTFSGNCKCAHLEKQRSHYNHIFYVGDGASDFCVSHHADCILAKSKLIDYCSQHQLAHYPIDGFEDLLTLWPSLFNKGESASLTSLNITPSSLKMPY